MGAALADAVVGDLGNAGILCVVRRFFESCAVRNSC